jgi:hypothetical protein
LNGGDDSNVDPPSHWVVSACQFLGEPRGKLLVESPPSGRSMTKVQAGHIRITSSVLFRQVSSFARESHGKLLVEPLVRSIGSISCSINTTMAWY